MNVLSHGAPFCCDYALLDAYSGRHDIRWLGIDPRARYQFDPIGEDANQVLKRIRNEWQPDLLLCWTPEIYPPPLGIEHADIPTAAVLSDWNVHYSVIAGNLSRFDTVLCDRAGVDILRPHGDHVHHVQPLYSRIPGIHRPHDVERDIDVLYIGSLNAAAHPRRARLLQRLAQLPEQYRVVILSGLVGEAYAHCLSRAKLVFNCSVRGELNLRVFETLACGAAAMLEADNAEVRDWLENDRDIVLYDDNLETRIAQVLQSDTWRTVAANGLARSEALAGEQRLDALLDWLAEQPAGDRAFRHLPEAESAYQDLLFYGFSRWKPYLPLREKLACELVARYPKDARFWTALARHLLPSAACTNIHEDQRAALKALTQAHRLEKDSAPYALNGATVCRAFEMPEQEAAFLSAALAASSLEGADLIMGNPACPFWNRWTRAVAERKTTLAMIHAEAHIRLAVLLASNGQPALAAEHLSAAHALDPQNHNGLRLEGEIREKSGHSAKAIGFMMTHLDAFPLDVEYRCRIAQIASASGDMPTLAKIREQLRLLKMRLPRLDVV